MTRRRTGEERTVRNLRSLLDVSKALGAEVLLDALLAVIIGKAREVMDAERASLFIHDEATNTLWNRVSEEVGRGEIRVPVGVGIAGHVAQSGKLLNVPDAYADPRFNPAGDRHTGFHTRSILCAPMVSHRGRMIGVIQVLNKHGDQPFSPEDEGLLEAFASLAGIALDRAHLVEAFLEKQRIEETLRLAHDIQMSMLPKRWPRRPEFELSAAIRPAREVGGDLYDFLVDGDRLWFIVGDVSGKGVGAALFMAVTKALFRASVHASHSPSVVAARINGELCQENERAMFVTAFLGQLDVATGRLEYVNAGHNPPYWMRAAGQVSATPATTRPPFGVVEDLDYPTLELQLAPGDGLFLYTDGITEALDASGQDFSEARLVQFLEVATQEEAADIVQGTLGLVEQFVGEAPQFDDMTLMSVRYLGG